MITLSIMCIVGVVLISVVLAILSIPFALIIGLLPWLLKVAAAVLLVKALLEKPFRRENLLPAAGAFIASLVIGWIF